MKKNAEEPLCHPDLHKDFIDTMYIFWIEDTDSYTEVSINVDLCVQIAYVFKCKMLSHV